MIDEIFQRFAFELGTAAGIGKNIDKEGRGVVVGNVNHFAQRALDLGTELSLAIGLDHEEEFHERRRIEGCVAVVIGAARSFWFGQVDDAQREIIGGESRKVL